MDLVDDRVSRRHARVSCRAGRFELEDHQSAAGTLPNGGRHTAAQHRPLRAGVS